MPCVFQLSFFKYLSSTLYFVQLKKTVFIFFFLGGGLDTLKFMREVDFTASKLSHLNFFISEIEQS